MALTSGKENTHMENLSPSSQAILAEMNRYHAERLAIFEREQIERDRLPYVYDGKYRLSRLLDAASQHRVPALAPYELEVSQRIAEQLQREPEPGYYFVPHDRQRLFRRDLTAAVAGAGGYLAGTETAPGNVFVGALLAMFQFLQRGMPIISLTGNASVPSVSGTITAGWLAN